jgi:hypothetical protein
MRRAARAARQPHDPAVRRRLHRTVTRAG